MFRFGHLSDIHFTYQSKSYDTNTLRDKLIEKLNELDRLDAIFITGDIFYRGDSGPAAEEKVNDYIVKIAKAARCEISNVFICAGNHDLKRYKGRANTLKSIIDDYIESNGDLNTSDYSSLIYTDVCVPFNQICERITGITNPEKIHRFVPMRDVNLIMLNTAVFAGQTYPGQKNGDGKLEDTNLFICDEKFRELKSDVNAFIDDNKLTICLGHHSTDCFESKERDRLTDYLDSIHCDLYLCGHIHAVATNLIAGTEATYRLSCGGPFKDNDNFNTPSFEVGEYDPVKHDLIMMLFNYSNSWELCNQARPPWRGGIWNRVISRLESIIAVDLSSVDPKLLGFINERFASYKTADIAVYTPQLLLMLIEYPGSLARDILNCFSHNGIQYGEWLKEWLRLIDRKYDEDKRTYDSKSYEEFKHVVSQCEIGKWDSYVTETSLFYTILKAGGNTAKTIEMQLGEVYYKLLLHYLKLGRQPSITLINGVPTSLNQQIL